MRWTRDCHGIPFRLVCGGCYAKIMEEKGYDKNEGFKKALLTTGSATLTHSLGKNDLHKTVLTQSEFCRRLILLENN